MAHPSKYNVDEVLSFFSGERKFPTFSDSSDSDVEPNAEQYTIILEGFILKIFRMIINRCKNFS